jgi:hypothetical protein
MVLANRDNDKAKSRVLRRFADQNTREMGLAYRQLQQNSGYEKERLLHARNLQKGALKRIVDKDLDLCGQAMETFKVYLEDCRQSDQRAQ